MVKFRNLLSKPESQEKKAIKKIRTDSASDDGFSHSNSVPQTPTSHINFKDILPEEHREPFSAVLSEEEQVSDRFETDAAVTDPGMDHESQTKTVKADAIRSKNSDSKTSYAITQISPSAEKSRQILYDGAAKYLGEVLAAVRARRKFLPGL